MKFTLVLSSKTIMQERSPADLLRKILDYNCFYRCEIFIRNSSGFIYDDVPELYKKLQHCIAIIRDRNVLLNLTVAMHQRDINADDKICVYEATVNGRVQILNRICPRCDFVVSDFCEFILKARFCLGLNVCDKVVLSYFRYENYMQCVCDRCLDAFGEFRKKNQKEFEFKNMMSLTSDDVIADWVLWRRMNMLEKAEIISGFLDGSGIIEIDFDKTKRYLEGVLVDEGLDFIKLLSYFREIYLHIEPASKNRFMNERINGVSAYVNQLRYLRKISSDAGTLLTSFFWFLNDMDSIKNNFNYYYNLSEAAGFNDMALYTERPVLLANYLRNNFVF